MRLSIEELKELYVEMIENEEMNSDAEMYARTCEHEDAGDRV